MRRRAGAGAALALLLGSGLLVACGTDESPDASQQPQGASLRIRLGTQEFPEGRILGELWRQALAVNGYAVDLRKGVGPAEDLDDALAAQQIDGYVAYTGTVLSVVAGEDVSGLDPEETYAAAQDFYATQDMVMSEMTPYENKDALATTLEFARDNQLTSIADLADARGVDGEPITLGARPEFEDLDLGLRGLQDVYGLDDLAFEAVPLGEQYAALDDGAVDVVDAFTTDPQLASGRYQLLEDPERLFGSQNVVMVVGEPKLERIDADAFLEVVDTVNRELTEEAVVGMNAEVTDGRDEADVAREFLRSVDLDRPLDLD
ncbi:ABC transporter substrate-binding protein [Nocardioides marmoraquaticus]